MAHLRRLSIWALNRLTNLAMVYSVTALSNTVGYIIQSGASGLRNMPQIAQALLLQRVYLLPPNAALPLIAVLILVALAASHANAHERQREQDEHLSACHATAREEAERVAQGYLGLAAAEQETADV